MKKAISILFACLISLSGFSQGNNGYQYTNIGGVMTPTASISAAKRNLLYSNSAATGGVAFAANSLYVVDGATAITSTLTVNAITAFGSGVKVPYAAKTANYKVTPGDYYINCTTDTFDVQLPTAVGRSGQVYAITSSDAGSVTATTTSAQTINGASTKVITTKKTLWVISDGANWIILSFS